MGTPIFNVAAGLFFGIALVSAATSVQAAGEPCDDQTSRRDAITALAPRLETGANPLAAESWGAVQLVVYKSKRSLALYRSGSFEKEYPVVLGLVPQGRKRHANDARTPEGLYRVVGKRTHDRWQYFLALDYPNAEDRKAYADEIARGRIPDEDGRPFAIGDSIGLHGNDREAEQAKGVDWTKGCIALRAADVIELVARVPVGTPVWIVE